jgi:hypothetical protein
MTARKPSKERFEWALLAQQGRYAEDVREIAKRLQEEFSQFPEPGEEALRAKLDALDDALLTLSDLNDRMALVRMLSNAIEHYKSAEGDDERDRARAALLVVLDELGRRVPEPGESGPQPETPG